VLAVPPGSTVAFPNFDGVFHNVFSLSPTKKSTSGSTRTATPASSVREAGHRAARVQHPREHGRLRARVDAPHYVVIDGAKPFNFKSLAPAATRSARGAERSAAPAESEIVIKPASNTAAFDVRGDAEPGPSEDKFGMTGSRPTPPCRASSRRRGDDDELAAAGVGQVDAAVGGDRPGCGPLLVATEVTGVSAPVGRAWRSSACRRGRRRRNQVAGRM